MIDNWIIGLQAVLQPMPLLMMMVGVLGGVVIGALPGLTAVMGVAVLMPFTFGMDPLSGMMMMAGIYTSAIYAGSIPAVLMRVPGTPSSAAAVLDGYPMAQQGRAGEALKVSLMSSFVGAFLGGILLALTAPLLAAIALKVTQGQYFMIALFALTVIASISEESIWMGLLSGVLGLFIATVGTDQLTGSARFTFGVPELRAGLDFIPILIGLFGISEAIHQYERRFRYVGGEKHGTGSFKLPKGLIRKLIPTWGSGTVIGYLIGVLPGTGGEVASFVSYNETRRWSKDKESFGKGNPVGLCAAETAHNAAVPGTLAPTITLGIPGNSVAAIMIGVLTVHGLRPGPQLFEGEISLVYGILWGFIIVAFMILLVGLLGIRAWGQILRIPPHLLWPGIVAICTLGAYSIRSSVFDVFVMFLGGLLGYAFDRLHIPTTPMVIGLLVGPIAETGFRRATMLAEGSFTWLLEPITLTMGILSIASIVVSFRRSRKAKELTGAAAATAAVMADNLAGDLAAADEDGEVDAMSATPALPSSAASPDDPGDEQQPES
jgi:putative tricarboxylic transport membrane protein